MPRPYRALWRQSVRKSHADLREILTWDLFEHWERNRMSHSTAAGELYYALELLYAGIDPPMARRYLRRCILVVDRSIKEDKFRRGRLKVMFPQNRGLAQRVRIYARALLGHRFDATALADAANDIDAWLQRWADRVHPVDQAHLVAAARMMLIAGQPARTVELLDGRSIKSQQREARLLLDIARAALVTPRIRKRALRKRLESLFDKVRSPKWKGRARYSDEPNEQRLELALIRQRYFIARDGKIDWNALMQSIRR